MQFLSSQEGCCVTFEDPFLKFVAQEAQTVDPPQRLALGLREDGPGEWVRIRTGPPVNRVLIIRSWSLG